jgi:hypothetical protein
MPPSSHPIRRNYIEETIKPSSSLSPAMEREAAIEFNLDLLSDSQDINESLADNQLRFGSSEFMGEQTKSSEGNEREPFASLDSIKSRSKESSITKRNRDSEAAGFNPSVKKNRHDYFPVDDLEERKPDFYIHPSAKSIGNIRIRPFKNEVKDMWFLHFMKQNDTISSDSGNTHMQVSAFELNQFISILKDQYREVKSCRLNEHLPRLKNSGFGKVRDHNLPEFWEKAHTDYLNSGTLAIRPFQNYDGTWTLRMWMPRKNNEKYSHWIGRTLSIPIGMVPPFVFSVEGILAFITQQLEEESKIDIFT